jgi:HEAT repeat protein
MHFPLSTTHYPLSNMHIRHAQRFVVFLSSLMAMAQAADAQKAAPEKEKELLAVLRSDVPKSEKAVTCKQLAVYGTSEAVPDLAKLLSDEQLASWARIALEAIPGKAADEALRKSLDSLGGKLLVGTINSVGVRRDAGAVDRLASRLKSQDDEVASAAAVALGHIANDAATSTLRKTLSTAPVRTRSAVAEGLVLCAEHLMSEGRAAQAVEIYDEVRKAEVPKQRVLEATRGAILARKEKGVALLIEQLHSSDKALFQLALSTVRELPGGQIDEALADELSRAPASRAALIIEAMADRPGAAVVPAVLKVAGSGPKEVRLAALAALGRVGNASCVAPLLEVATDSDPDLAKSAKAALAELKGDQWSFPAPRRGDDVDQEIVDRLAKAQGKSYAVLIELVGARRIEDPAFKAVPALVKALDRSDPMVRRAALTALGETVSANDLSVLISAVVAPKHAEDATAAQQALKTASVRMPDREQCAEALAKALHNAPSPAQGALVDILAAVGGTNALAAVGAAAKSDDPDLQDTSSRLLGEWMTADAAPVLLDLAKSGNKYQARALRGYIRIARQFVLPEPERIEMCQKALEACRQPAEKKLVLDVLKRYPSQGTLKLAMKLADVPELKDDATQAVLAIAQKIGDKSDAVRGFLSQAGLQKVKLEIVKAEYGAGQTLKDVTEAVRKQAADVPMITLTSESYNEAFGGDPVPNTVKQLKIQYKINGKPGEASFAENALIILPLPK